MLKIYSVYDSKTEAYLQPFFAPAHGSALRMFQQAVEEPGHQFHRFSADFTLFCIGSFDEQKGTLTSLEHLINLGNGIEFHTAVTRGDA